MTPIIREGMMAGKAALITGAASGIGAAAAELFARAGAAVAMADRDVARGLALADAIKAVGGNVAFIEIDVTEKRAVAAMVAQTVELFGGIDAAFNNAGTPGGYSTAVSCTTEECEQVNNINMRSIWLCMKHEIPEMLKRGGGSVVNMASRAGDSANPNMFTYAATKHGVAGMTRSAALDFGTKKVRVNALLPGMTQSPMLEKARTGSGMGGGAALDAVVRSVIPMRRVGRPNEQAEAALWLCSQRSSYVTGTTLVVDGGYVCDELIVQFRHFINSGHCFPESPLEPTSPMWTGNRGVKIMDVKGAAVIVTGGHSGTGFVTAKRLTEEGARVAIFGRRAELVKNKANEIGALGLTCDISNYEAVYEAVSSAERAHGPARILVNAAAIGTMYTLLQADGSPTAIQTIRSQIEANVYGTLFIDQAFASRLTQTGVMDDGIRGLIINVSSIAAADGALGAVYAASKGAVDAITVSLARELGVRGIRVCTISPGGIETEMFLDGATPERLDSFKRHTPGVHRLGRPDEFARLAMHVCENDYLNAVNIRCDGGFRVPYSFDVGVNATTRQ